MGNEALVDGSAARTGRWLVFGQAIGGGTLVIVWWLFPAAGWPAVAVGLALAGGSLAGAAGLALGPSFRVGPEPLGHATLVRAGIYRWVRHPMYIGAMLVVAAAAISRPSWPVILVALANFAWYLLKAGFEEGRLLARYPDYASYRRSTVGLPALRPRRKP